MLVGQMPSEPQRPREDTVDALLETVRELLRAEEARATSLNMRTEAASTARTRASAAAAARPVTSSTLESESAPPSDAPPDAESPFSQPALEVIEKGSEPDDERRGRD